MRVQEKTDANINATMMPKKLHFATMILQLPTRMKSLVQIAVIGLVLLDKKGHCFVPQSLCSQSTNPTARPVLVAPRDASLVKDAMQASSTVFFSLVLSFSALFFPTTSNAADYNSLSPEQKAVAEAWRLVDFSYLDRTFNHQDWFQLRQDLVYGKKYKNMQQAQDSIETILASLGDKYTRYLPPAKYQSIVDSATGTLAGVGIEISTNKQGNLIASDVEANSPASIAGVQPGDVFVEVDGTRFDEKSTPDDVALKLRGPKGSKVGVVMERNSKTLDYIITRDAIKVTSVRPYLSNMGGGVGGKVGVIRIKSFSGTTADTVKSAYQDLKKKGAQSFVIDVRGNPGGLLPGGVDTASLFLNSNKPVVFVVDKKGVVDSQSTFADGIDLESPLVVLVDSNTASAAEVFAAALKGA